MELSDIKSQYEAYAETKKITHFADEETAERLRINVGDEYYTYQIPENREDAFERLEKYIGLVQLVVHIEEFDGKYIRNKRALNDELAVLNEFIEEAEKISLVDAFDNKKMTSQNNFKYEYLRFAHGYYERKQFAGFAYFFEGNSIYIYGKYFLYKKWLENELKTLETPIVYNPIIQHTESLRAHEQINPKKKISIFETIKRELSTIQHIFSSQLMKASSDTLGLINEDGRICPFINIRSDRELHRIEEYRQHYTERYESSRKTEVVKNELIELYRKASEVADYYNTRMAYDKNNVVKEFYDGWNANKFLSEEERAFRTMIVLVVDYLTHSILFGYDMDSNDPRTIYTIRKYNYAVDISQLVDFCYHIIEFINRFEIPELQFNESDKIGNLNDNIEINVIHRSEHPEMFETSGKDVGGSESTTNPYPQIFINREAYLLFERWHSNYKNNRTLLADYSFIYRQMSKDKLILETYKPEMFRQWISQEPYNIYLDAKFKTFDRCSTIGKINLYKSLKPL